MRRQAAAVALSASLLAVCPASADDKKPDPARIRAAAAEFDAGVGALKKKDYEGAASHFEVANATVPSPTALRQAIRARVEAGQGSLAATLSVHAIERYGHDAVLSKLARETVEKFEPLLYKVSVTCASPCVLAVGTRSVPGEAGTRRVVYLDPGSATINATFPGQEGPGAPPRDVEAKAGDGIELRFEPKKKPRPPPPPDPEVKSKSELPPDDPKPEAEPEPERKGISPAFFGVSLAATVGVGVATIWSGVDTQANPGTAAVMAACQGKGTSCPLYQEGLAKQTRTNALIGATAGTAALTIVLAVFTNWRGAKKPPGTPAARVTLGVPPDPRSRLFVARGAVLGAAGAF
jgi:hypothetical protein